MLITLCYLHVPFLCWVDKGIFQFKLWILGWQADKSDIGLFGIDHSFTIVLLARMQYTILDNTTAGRSSWQTVVPVIIDTLSNDCPLIIDDAPIDVCNYFVHHCCRCYLKVTKGQAFIFTICPNIQIHFAKLKTQSFTLSISAIPASISVFQVSQKKERKSLLKENVLLCKWQKKK